MGCKYIAGESPPPPPQSWVFCQIFLTVFFLFTPGWRQALCELSILPKGHNTMPDSTRVRIRNCLRADSKDHLKSTLRLFQDSPIYSSRHMSPQLSLHVTIKTETIWNYQICSFTYQRRKILRTNRLYRPSGLTVT